MPDYSAQLETPTTPPTTPNTFRDLIFSHVRTIVPNLIAMVLTLLARKFNIVIDEGTKAQLLVVVFAAVFAGYYSLVRLLEAKVSPRFSILLGDGRAGNTAPTYPDPAVPVVVPPATTPPQETP